MRTTRQFPGGFVLLLAFQIIMQCDAFAQINSENVPHTFVPLPKLLVNSEGIVIESSRQWEDLRRNEVLELFRDYVYGHVPRANLSVGFEVKYLDMNALGNSAIQKEVEVKVSNGSETHSFSILIFLPKAHKVPVPLFLGLNFKGNHTIHPDEQIGITESWVENDVESWITENKATAESRGIRANRWPVELILSRGYGLATIYAGDIDPDFDDGFKNGIHALVPGQEDMRDQGDWGTLATWAWGLSRAMDYFEKDADVDHERVAVIGHSRMGKAALWAGASDERFAMVISNNSGCGGAALSRRAFGERVSRINTVFPHWFADRFNVYNDNELALPVDQHMLLALIAPRPLYVASAKEDEWADPHGEYLSLYYGSKVYGLYGQEMLMEDQLPPVDQPRWVGNLGYHIRTGAHGITVFDWEQYLSFADKHLEPETHGEEVNPVSMEWINEHLNKTTPRLILNPRLEDLVRTKLGAGDAFTTMGLQLLHQSAKTMMELDPLVYEKTGRRLLGVSREAIRRLTTLALVYRFERDERYLRKLEVELKAVCSFNDWNPSHFLDVAEMAAGIALSLDWAGEWISPDVRQIARQALVEKALKPGIAASNNNGWVNVQNNWNLVCHGGLSIAALAVFEDEPEIASMILNRAVEKIPLALEPYAPGGIYPEGPSYWFYATTYLTAAVSAYESALGTEFGFTDAPGVMESTIFSQITAGPSNDYFNYFDAGLDGFQSLEHFGMLSWFASRSGSGVNWSAYKTLLEKELSNQRGINGTRFFSLFFLYTALLDHDYETVYEYPEAWTGGGDEPICIFRDKENNPESFFLAAKGGRAADNHGNMDAGSFIFELEGVRWSVDPGNQGYHELEVIMGGELWNRAQNSGRWKLLTKNNFGHSTLNINGKMHLAETRATLVREDIRTTIPEVTFDLTPLFGEDIEKASRTFSRTGSHVLRISDLLVFSPQTRTITWQMMTEAEVKIKNDQIVLKQDGKELYLQVLSKEHSEVEVVNLSPPPLPYDKDIPGLKRIEIKFDRNSFKGDSGQLIVELTSQEIK